MTTPDPSKSLLVPLAIAIAVGILAEGLSAAAGESVAFLGKAIVGLIPVNLINPGVADTRKARVTLRGGQPLRDTTRATGNAQVTLKGESFKGSDNGRRSAMFGDRNRQIRGTVQPEKSTADIEIICPRIDETADKITPNIGGTGIQVDLAVATKVIGTPQAKRQYRPQLVPWAKGQDRQPVFDVLKRVIVSLLPRNLFPAMAENRVLPSMMFSLAFGGMLTTAGSLGEDVLHLWNSGSGTGDDGDRIKGAHRYTALKKRCRPKPYPTSIFQ